jgi:hypothetical protein
MSRRMRPCLGERGAAVGTRRGLGAQGGQPADIQFVRIVKHLAGCQMVAGVVTRLFLPHMPGLDG